MVGHILNMFYTEAHPAWMDKMLHAITETSSYDYLSGVVTARVYLDQDQVSAPLASRRRFMEPFTMNKYTPISKPPSHNIISMSLNSSSSPVSA